MLAAREQNVIRFRLPATAGSPALWLPGCCSATAGALLAVRANAP